MKSIRDIYKIGTGPSSSHTMGPARAAVLFRGEHPEADKFQAVLYGSLSKTGRGHGTDRAIRDAVAPAAAEVIFSQEDPKDMKHPNTMDLVAFHGTEELGRIRVQSIGGGDIVIEGREQELESEEIYMENSFAEILQFCQYRYVDLVEYIEMNEGPDIWDYLIGVWHVMKRSVEEGLSRTGELPGGLHIQRKAKYMHDHIVETKHPELVECQKVCSYAYAVSEQNADNGTIVTAPTCGSCGVLPAVLYYFEGKRGLSELDIAHALAWRVCSGSWPSAMHPCPAPSAAVRRRWAWPAPWPPLRPVRLSATTSIRSSMPPRYLWSTIWVLPATRYAGWCRCLASSATPWPPCAPSTRPILPTSSPVPATSAMIWCSRACITRGLT